MRLTWLGWAGVELEAGDATVVVDPLDDASAVFAPLGERAAGTPLATDRPAERRPGRRRARHAPPPRSRRCDGARVRAPPRSAQCWSRPPVAATHSRTSRSRMPNTSSTAAGLERRRVAPWDTVSVGPFTLTALPAADGVGDPQVAWLVEAEGVRVLHLGDTMFHGYWWRIALRHGPFDVVLVPVNGAVVGFPHRVPASPLPVALDPAQAAVAAEILGARLAIPIHAEGYEIDGVYEPAADAAQRFAAAASERSVPVRILEVGETIDVVAAEVVA